MWKFIEAGLHVGNIGAAIATVADVTLAGGAGTTIGALLSATAILSKLNKQEKAVAAGLKDILKQSHMTEDRKRIVIAMLARHAPTEPEIARGNRVEQTVAGQMAAQIAQDETTDAGFRTPVALDDYKSTLAALLAPVFADDTANEASHREELKRLDELLAISRRSDQYKRFQKLGIDEAALIGLARQKNAAVEDIDQAWIELQRTMNIAIDFEETGTLTSNHPSFVDEVLATAKEKARHGDYAAALSDVEGGLKRTEAELAEAEDAVQAKQSQAMRLAERGSELALLEGNTDRAATLLIRKADLEAGGSATLQDLSRLWKVYYERGRDAGINLDLELAIALADQILARAESQDERGSALNDLGAALQTSGARSSDTAQLEAAVRAYEAALEEWTQERVPLDWAMTQNNLGTALSTLGERNGDTAQLEAAVRAYEAALEERTQERVPLNWAATQNNLGIALGALGERSSDTAQLEAAVAAFKAALEEWTQERVPLDWAMTQNNLGTALSTLGERNGDTAQLEAAVRRLIGAGRADARAGSAQLGGDAEQPWQCAPDLGQTQQRHRTA
ncbi:MAG: tetratricopeptide repeat protein [Pseudomonadota bacterium]